MKPTNLLDTRSVFVKKKYTKIEKPQLALWPSVVASNLSFQRLEKCFVFYVRVPSNDRGLTTGFSIA